MIGDLVEIMVEYIRTYRQWKKDSKTNYVKKIKITPNGFYMEWKDIVSKDGFKEMQQELNEKMKPYLNQKY